MGGKKKEQGGEKKEPEDFFVRWVRLFHTHQNLDKTKKHDWEELAKTLKLSDPQARALARCYPNNDPETNNELWYRFPRACPTIRSLKANEQDMIQALEHIFRILMAHPEYLDVDGTVKYWGLVSKDLTDIDPRFARCGFVLADFFGAQVPEDVFEEVQADIEAQIEAEEEHEVIHIVRRADAPDKKEKKSSPKKKKSSSSSSAGAAAAAAPAAAAPKPKKSRKRVISLSSEEEEVVEKPSSSSSSSSKKTKKIKLATTPEEIQLIVNNYTREEFEEYLIKKDAEVRKAAEIAKKRALARAAKKEAEAKEAETKRRMDALLAITGGNLSMLTKTSPSKKIKTTVLPTPTPTTPVVVREEEEEKKKEVTPTTTTTIPPTQLFIEEEEEVEKPPTTPKPDPTSPLVYHDDEFETSVHDILIFPSPIGKTSSSSSSLPPTQEVISATEKVVVVFENKEEEEEEMVEPGVSKEDHPIDAEIKNGLAATEGSPVVTETESPMSWGYDPVGLKHGKIVEITDPYACPHDKCGHVRNHQAWVGRSRHVKDTLKCGMCNLDVKAKKLIKVMETAEQYFSHKTAGFRSCYIKDE